MEVSQVIACGNILGEGPWWDTAEQTLYWVDIDGKKIQRFLYTTLTYESFDQPLKVSLAVRRRQGGFICATEKGFHFWNPADNRLEFIYDPEEGKIGARFNDGKADRSGRLWAGTMTHGGDASSALYRLGTDLQCEQMAEGITISNGIGWSPDQRVMYHTDSLRRVIYAYDYDAESGEIRNRREFTRIDPAAGEPDGLTVDSEGYVWSALYDGWKVTRYDPHGRTVLEVALPVARPSSCAFGGPEMNKLFITTISEGLSAAEKEAQPLAGDVLVFDSEYRGLEEPLFGG